MSEHYKYFSHKQCEYYPCHKTSDDDFNCLFCFCPLYALGKECGGNYKYIGDIKDCSDCLLPHKKANYEYIMKQFSKIVEKSKE